MNRTFAYLFVVAMLFTVIGQGIQLRSMAPQPITEIELHPSRLLPFLTTIQTSHPHIYDSIIFNLRRIQPAQQGHEGYKFEEILVAGKLLSQLTHH